MALVVIIESVLRLPSPLESGVSRALLLSGFHC